MFYNLFDASMFEHHFLMVTLDLFVSPAGDEPGHVHEDSIAFSCGLAFELPLVIRKVGDIGVVFGITPDAILLVFLSLQLVPCSFDLWLL